MREEGKKKLNEKVRKENRGKIHKRFNRNIYIHTWRNGKKNNKGQEEESKKKKKRKQEEK